MSELWLAIPYCSLVVTPVQYHLVGFLHAVPPMSQVAMRYESNGSLKYVVFFLVVSG